MHIQCIPVSKDSRMELLGVNLGNRKPMAACGQPMGLQLALEL